MKFYKSISIFLLAAVLVASCTPKPTHRIKISEIAATATVEAPAVASAFTPRPNYQPGELVDYTVQTGDTLAALAAHFNTTEAEIRRSNPVLPPEVTTLPPGMPMKIPIYYEPLWGTQFQIIPDAAFINGPVAVGFSTENFVNQHPGWLKYMVDYNGTTKLVGGQIVDRVATDFSINPMLLLALLEYQSGALSNPQETAEQRNFPLGYESWRYEGTYMQLVWAANYLNDVYAKWRAGDLNEFDLSTGKIEKPDPWQNSATVSLQRFFAEVLDEGGYRAAIEADGFARTYKQLFGDPWTLASHIPGSLQQPAMQLPFMPNTVWAYTGGPHTGWGTGLPNAAIDFAPPSVVGGCTPSTEWVTAIADGLVVRAEEATVVLDLDMDGDERTGWVVFYLHLATQGKAVKGQVVMAGDPVGHPSCEGGRSTGTHVHIARKYNGEWIPATGALAFNLEGWVAGSNGVQYQGSLTRYGRQVIACLCSDVTSQLMSDIRQ